MKIKTVCVVLLVSLVKISHCQSSLEESQAELSLQDRTVDIGTYLQKWVSSILWVDYGNSKYFAFPQKNTLPIYFNLTGIESRAFIGGLLLAGAGGYLLTQIPIIDGWRRSADYEEGLGFGRTYDEFDEEYDISTEYEYSYPDSFYSAASEPAGSFIKKNKQHHGERKFGNMKRRTGDPGHHPGLREATARRQKPAAGLFETITNAVKSIFSPNIRRSDLFLGGGLESMVKRYDGYWQARRTSAGKPNWELDLPRKKARSEDLSESSRERFIGPNLPQLKKEAGSGFYKDRIDNYFDSESQ